MRRLRRAVLLLAGAAGPLLAAQPAHAQTAVPLSPSTDVGPCPNPAPGYTCTVSTTHQTFVTRQDLPDATAYATRVLGYAVLSGPGLSQTVTAFDQTALDTPTSATVVGLFGRARAAARSTAIALAAGRPFVAIIENGPIEISRQTSSSTALVSHTLFFGGPGDLGPTFTFTISSGPWAGTYIVPLPPETNVASTTISSKIGPGTVLTGENQGVSLFVPAGTVDLSLNIAAESYYVDTYQTTILNSATYAVTETLILQLIGTIHPAVQSASFDLGGRFLRGLGDDADLGRCGANAVHCAWADGSGLWSRDRAQAMVPGNSARAGAFAAGLGFRVAPGLSLGFGVGEGWSAIDQEVGSEHADLTYTQFGLDAAYRAGGWRLAAALLGATGRAGAHHGDTSLGGTSTASYDLSMWGARGEIGYRIGAGSWSLTPKLGGDWTRVHSDAFAEAGGPALAAPAHNADRTRGWIGLAAEDDVPFGAGRVELTAEARLVDVLSGRARVLPVTFAGQALAVEGLTEGRIAGAFSLGAAIHFSPAITFAATGEGEVAQHGGRAWSGRAAFSVAF